MKSAEQGHENAIGNLQILDKNEGRTTPSFTPLKRCSTCNTSKTSTHKLKNCKCKGAQYCDATCQTAHWKSHQKEHRRLCKEMKLTNTGRGGDKGGGILTTAAAGRGGGRVSSLHRSTAKGFEKICTLCMLRQGNSPMV